TATSMLFYGSPVTSGDGLGIANESHIHMGSTGKLAFFIRGTTADVDLISSGSYNDGLWHHVAATWNANGNAVLYVDGIQVAAQVHDANLFDLSAIVRLGRPGQATRHYAGKLDRVNIYDVALTAAQVQALADE
ncbi:MAG: Fibronectin type protein, partial [Paenibacillus sp.]|nr:Fibronectin type protein [Paenibacillus sp.]